MKERKLLGQTASTFSVQNPRSMNALSSGCRQAERESVIPTSSAVWRQYADINWVPLNVKPESDGDFLLGVFAVGEGRFPGHSHGRREFLNPTAFGETPANDRAVEAVEIAAK